MNLPALPATQVLGHDAVDWGIVAVFAVVYLGMFLGGLPRLKLDRSGVALLGAIAVIALSGQSVDDAARAVDLPTIVLLFAFMVVSAQMRLGGFYTEVTRRVGTMPLSHNGLIGSVLELPFAGYLRQALPAVDFGMVLLWLWPAYGPSAHLPVAPGRHMPSGRDAPAGLPADDAPPFDAFQTAKGLLVAGALLVIFLFTDWPRDLIAVDLARESAIAIDGRQHAVTGIPVTIGTLALAWAWLRWTA
jgi:hypothetical protein